ncbi:MAG: hypothetical protein QOJ51_3663, partial [Acidobacteriaceae bacterium]|nr:hypothetical protein [Acidobacteriaceae bacterium]
MEKGSLANFKKSLGQQPLFM